MRSRLLIAHENFFICEFFCYVLNLNESRKTNKLFVFKVNYKVLEARFAID